MRPSRSTAFLAVAACTFACSAGAWLLAQQPTTDQPRPTFRTGTDVVRLEVTVLDGERRPLRGLTAADFTIREDGRDRPIVAFTPVDLPSVSASTVATAPWVRDAPQDVVTNTGPREGRLVVIAFDWSIRFMEQAAARRIALSAIDGLAPGDQAAVVFTSASAAAGIPQNFTADRALLRAAVNRPFATAVIDFFTPNRQGIENPEGRDSGECLCRTCTMEALTRVAQGLRDVSQRPKVVLFIGTYVRVYETPAPMRPPPRIEGRITPSAYSREGVCSIPLRTARQSLERAAGESNVTIHVIDPTGLETAESTPLGDGSRIQERQETLPALADMTGGRTVRNTNAPEEQVASILEESGSYYLLGFAPGAAAPDGRTRRIEVRVRQRGAVVKARDRYTYARATGASAKPMTKALDSLLPAANLPMALQVASFGTADSKRAMVTISASVGPFAPEPGPGAVTAAPFELVASAYDPGGHPKGSAGQTLQMSWAPRGAGEPPPRVDVLSRLDLEPGNYEIRVAAVGADPSRASSVFTYVTVPDYATAPLSLSHVVFDANAGTAIAPRDFLAPVLPVAPTTQRTFTRAEGATAFVQLYQGTMRRDPLQAVTLRVRVLDGKDATVHEQSLTLAPERFATGRTAGNRLSVPVKDLAPGDYLLSVDATMGERTAGRVVRFSVR